MALLLGHVAQAQTEVGLPFSPSHPSGGFAPPVAPPIQPPPMLQTDPETGETTDGRPDLRDWQLGEGLGIVAMFLFRFVLWLITPVCLLLEIFFDWMGFTGTVPVLNLDAGLVGYVLGMVDAWIPAHEIIFETMKLWGVMILWTPFRILVKYLFPGLG